MEDLNELVCGQRESWQTHRELCIDQTHNIESLSSGQRERMLLARFEIVKLTDEVWSNYDFISKSVFTPV